MKKIIINLAILISITLSAQIGINTNNPSAALDIISKTADENEKTLKISHEQKGDIFSILNNGKVSINHGNPQATLDILHDHLSNENILRIANTSHPEILTINNNGLIGIGTSNPLTELDINGGIRLRIPNAPRYVYSDVSNLLIDNQGNLVQAPLGSPQIIGGYRPGTNNKVITTIDATNSITRIRFMVYIDQSSEANNNVEAAYTYGDFTIIAMPKAPARIVQADIRGHDGMPKGNNTWANFAQTDTSITWTNQNQAIKLGTIAITINQTTGELKINSANGVVLSYFFEIMGGI